MIKYFAYRWKIACSISHPSNIFINSKNKDVHTPHTHAHAHMSVLKEFVGGIFNNNKDVEVKMMLLFFF